MKIISLIEPFASLMAVSAKRNETRSWSTNYRGELAIAASQKIPTEVRHLLLQGEFADACRKALGGTNLIHEFAYKSQFGCGHILCVVDVWDMIPTGGIKLAPPEGLFGDYTYGRWAWRTNNCRRLRHPIPWKGMLGLGNVPPEIEAAIRSQI